MNAKSLGINWTADCAVCHVHGQGIMFDIYQFFSLAKRISRLAQTTWLRTQLRSTYLCKPCMERLEIIEKFEDMRQEFVAGFLGNFHSSNPAEKPGVSETGTDKPESNSQLHQLKDDDDNDCEIITSAADNAKMTDNPVKSDSILLQSESNSWSGSMARPGIYPDDPVTKNHSPAVASSDTTDSQVTVNVSTVVTGSSPAPVHVSAEPQRAVTRAQSAVTTKVDPFLEALRHIRPKAPLPVNNSNVTDDVSTDATTHVIRPQIPPPNLRRIMSDVTPFMISSSSLATTRPLKSAAWLQLPPPPNLRQIAPRCSTSPADTNNTSQEQQQQQRQQQRQQSRPKRRKIDYDDEDAASVGARELLVDNYMLNENDDNEETTIINQSTDTDPDQTLAIKLEAMDEPPTAENSPIKVERIHSDQPIKIEQQVTDDAENTRKPERNIEPDPVSTQESLSDNNNDDGLSQIKIEDCRSEHQSIVDLTSDDDDDQNDDFPLTAQSEIHQRLNASFQRTSGDGFGSGSILETVVESFLNLDSPKAARPTQPAVEQTKIADRRRGGVSPLRPLRQIAPAPPFRVAKGDDLPAQKCQPPPPPPAVNYVVNNLASTSTTAYQLNTGAPQMLTYTLFSEMPPPQQQQQQQQQQQHQIMTQQVVMVGGIPTLAYVTSSSSVASPAANLIRSDPGSSGGLSIVQQRPNSGSSGVGVQRILPKMPIYPVKTEKH